MYSLFFYWPTSVQQRFTPEDNDNGKNQFFSIQFFLLVFFCGFSEQLFKSVPILVPHRKFRSKMLRMTENNGKMDKWDWKTEITAIQPQFNANLRKHVFLPRDHWLFILIPWDKTKPHFFFFWKFTATTNSMLVFQIVFFFFFFFEIRTQNCTHDLITETVRLFIFIFFKSPPLPSFAFLVVHSCHALLPSLPLLLILGSCFCGRDWLLRLETRYVGPKEFHPFPWWLGQSAHLEKDTHTNSPMYFLHM